jgi:MFS family permease
MVLIPMATSFETLLMALVPMAFGSTILSSVPMAILGDVVQPHERPQAISFLRFMGDVGFLLGAAFSGVISTHSSLELTMQANSVFIAAGIGLFFLRRRASNVATKQ